MIDAARTALAAAILLALAACGPAGPEPEPEPEPGPANGTAPAAAATPASRPCRYLVEFVDPATLKAVAPALTVNEPPGAARGQACPQLPAGWRPLPSPVGGGADPAPGSEAAARLAKVRAAGSKAILTVTLVVG